MILPLLKSHSLAATVEVPTCLLALFFPEKQGKLYMMHKRPLLKAVSTRSWRSSIFFPRRSFFFSSSFSLSMAFWFSFSVLSSFSGLSLWDWMDTGACFLTGLEERAMEAEAKGLRKPWLEEGILIDQRGCVVVCLFDVREAVVVVGGLVLVGDGWLQCPCCGAAPASFISLNKAVACWLLFNSDGGVLKSIQCICWHNLTHII